MSFVIKINTYYNHRGIEIQEEELISGKMPPGRPQYTAMVNIKVKTIDGQEFPHQISTKFHAVGIEDAFKKAENALQEEINEFQSKAEEEIKGAKEAEYDNTAPRIITPD